MRDHVPGEQYAQVDNADPFTAPVWRSPVYRTPEWVIWLVQLVRLLIRVIWFLIRHPLLDVAAGIVVTIWAKAGWPGVVVLANVTVAALVTFRWRGRTGTRGSSRSRSNRGGGGGVTGAAGSPS